MHLPLPPSVQSGRSGAKPIILPKNTISIKKKGGIPHSLNPDVKWRSSVYFALPTNTNKQFSTRILEIRKAHNLTQAQVAQRLGMTQGGYGHYERGIRRIPLDMLSGLAAALECSEDDILGTRKKTAKRGPQSRWEKKIENIRLLPRDKQREIENVVDALIDRAT